jgi:16S rRNA (cytosine967-C5)-methyltransferase
VLSRHPDGKWNRSREGIRSLALVQKAMLHRASGVLKGGGKLLYVTCTVSREENEGVVERFLESHPGMVLEDIGDGAPGWARDLVDERGFLRTLPHLHGMDGFFAALFRSRQKISRQAAKVAKLRYEKRIISWRSWRPCEKIKNLRSRED